MAVLKRIKGSTLMETMVATILIIVIFMMASLVMESTVTTRIRGNTEPLLEKFHRLGYRYAQGTLKLPYVEAWNDWDIEITNMPVQRMDMIVIQAKNRTTQKQIKNYLAAYDENN